MSLSRAQLVKNSVWTILELVLSPLLIVLATPMFITKLGIEQYGVWMLITTITQIINILNPGIGDSNIRLIAQYRAEEKPLEIVKIFRMNFTLSILMFILACVLGMLLYLFDTVSLFTKNTDASFGNMILLLANVGSGVKFMEISILSVFKAYERFDLYSKLSIISKNSTIISNILVIVFYKDLLLALQIGVIINALNIILQLIILHNFNNILIGKPELSHFKGKLEELRYNFWYWLQSSISLIGFLSDKLAVAWFTDEKTLGYYSIASMIGTNIHNFFLAFGGFAFPRVSFKFTQKHNLQPLYFVSRSLIALPGWLLILVLLTLGDPVFELWLGKETYINSIFLIKLYLVFEAGMLLIITPYFFINGTSKIKLNSLFEIIIRLSHFILMLVGYHYYDVNGMVFGLIASTLLNIPFQYALFNRSVLHAKSNAQFLLVILPWIFLSYLAFTDNLILNLCLLLITIILAKLIYFDKARKYFREFTGSGT